jgi:putative transposase
MIEARKELRRAAFYLAIPPQWRDISNWPAVDPNTVPDLKKRARLIDLTRAATAFLNQAPFREVKKLAGLSETQFFHLMGRALDAQAGTDQICGTRAFVRNHVQAARERRAPAGKTSKFGGYTGLFKKLVKDRPEIFRRLTEFLNGKERPNTVTPHLIHAKFIEICRDEGLCVTDYPLSTKSKGYEPLQDWYEKVYQFDNRRRHIEKQHGPAAAVAALYELGDGTSRTPPMPYTVWVIDEMKVDLEAVIELPMARWDVEFVALSQFQVLRCRSIGNVACNIAWHMCLRQQAAGPDIIRLFRNAVLGQPTVDCVEPTIQYEKGAGFPQNVFEPLRYAVPILVYLDNALSHLFNPLQNLLQRLFGGRVLLGIPGRPKGRPDIESSIGHLVRALVHQLPGTTGTGPQDPLRERAAIPVGKRVQIGLLEQALDVYFANQNVMESSGAGYLDSFTRLARLVLTNKIKCNYLPEIRRKPHNFCEPKPVTVHCDLKDNRGNFVLFKQRRYSSPWLKVQPGLGGKKLFAMVDYDDLRTLELVDQLFATFNVVTCEGPMANVPHDQRMLEIISKNRSDARYRSRPGDSALFGVLRHLAGRARRDSQAALEYAYIMRYLKRQLPPEVIQDQVLAVGAGDEFLDIDAVVVPDKLPLPPPLQVDGQPLPESLSSNAPPLRPAATPSPASEVPTALVRRFVVPRRLG